MEADGPISFFREVRKSWRQKIMITRDMNINTDLNIGELDNWALDCKESGVKSRCGCWGLEVGPEGDWEGRREMSFGYVVG